MRVWWPFVFVQVRRCPISTPSNLYSSPFVFVCMFKFCCSSVSSSHKLAQFLSLSLTWWNLLFKSHKISCFWTFFFCSVSALVSNSGLWISFVGIQICSRYWWYQVVLFYFLKKIALELDYSLACHNPRMLFYIVSSNLCPGLKGNFTLLQKRKSKTK